MNDASDRQKMCSCALFVEASLNAFTKSYAFVDVCGANQEVNKQFRYFTTQNTQSLLESGDFPLINCNTLLVAENDESEWARVPVSFGVFKCARLRTSTPCDTYIVNNTILKI